MDNIDKNVDKFNKSELELQAAMLTTLLDTNPDLIFVKDLNLRYTHFNKAFLDYFGLDESLYGKTDAEGLGVSLEMAEHFNETDRRVIREGVPNKTEELVPDVHGSFSLFESLKAPLILNGSIIGVWGRAHDITAQKEIERAMMSDIEYAKKLNDALSRITKLPAISAGDLKIAADIITQEGGNTLNAHHVGIWLHSAEKAALESVSYYDVSAGINIEKDDYNLLEHPKYAELLKAQRLIVMNNPIECELIYPPGHLCAALDAPIRVDGALVGVVCIEQMHCEKFPDGRAWTMEEQSFVSSLADLAALAISGHERRKAREEAEVANKAKSSFLANMSHEIRTPMNSIIGFSELALDDDVSEKTRGYLSNILENSHWLLHIINDILDISKIESGKLEIEHIPFDLHDLFAVCRAMITSDAADKGIALHFYAEPSLGKMPLGDPIRLRQVLVNLLSNAVKFTDSGIIKIQSVIRETSDKHVSIYFEVRDSGIGMTAEQIKRVLNPFIQAESGTTRKYGGTGLGLSITKNLIELMGGNLNVESTPGVGSKFSFELSFDTIDINEDNIAKTRLTLNELKKPTFQGEILLCEDNTMNQQVICEHLARVGLETVVAENGKVGVEMVQSRMQKGEKQFDLIFMDIHMPVMDGLEASEKILALKVGVPIVAMTANIMIHDRELYKENGMVDYVGKPFTSQELWHCLMKFFTPLSLQEEDESQRMHDENELQKKLINNFVNNNRDKYREIVDAINSDDIKLAHRLAHTLKGNAGQLKKALLQRAAGEIEYALSSGENHVTWEQLKIFKKELGAVIEEFSSMVQDVKSPNPTEDTFDTEATHKLLNELEPLLEKGDPECLLLIEKLRAIPGSEELIQKMEAFDFNSAAGVHAKLVKSIG